MNNNSNINDANNITCRSTKGKEETSKLNTKTHEHHCLILCPFSYLFTPSMPRPAPVPSSPIPPMGKPAPGNVRAPVLGALSPETLPVSVDELAWAGIDPTLNSPSNGPLSGASNAVGSP